MARLVIDHATSGNNTLIAAAGANKRIRVHAWHMVAAGTVTAAFEDDADGTALTGDMSMVVGVPNTSGWCEEGWFETSADTLLNLELGGAIQVSGVLIYTVVGDLAT